MRISKSRYTGLRQCPRMQWLRVNRPEEAAADEAAQSRFEAGNEVGDLARGLFGPYVNVTVTDAEGNLDLSAMIEATARQMEKGTPVLCEASFAVDDLYCAVDLLVKRDGGWAIYEVKSSSHKDDVPEVYLQDIAFQKEVLERCGVTVTGTYLVRVNSSYVRGDALDIHQLFAVTDTMPYMEAAQAEVMPAIREAMPLLDSGTEPQTPLCAGCFTPYECAFWGHCTQSLPKPNVFDLYSLRNTSKLSLYQEGIVTFGDVLAQKVKLKNKLTQRQVEFALQDRGMYADKAALREYLDTLTFPLYFLDFETMMDAIPRWPGIRPFQQVPTQYSLHILSAPEGELTHREFLGEPEEDPRRALAEQICRDIPADAVVTAYNRTFECGVLKALADAFPDLSAHLLAVRDHIIDLLVPFRSGWCYNRAMGGSFSIKSVLPALYPHDPALDYHALDGVHNGSEAMNAFPAMAAMTPELRALTRQSLLRYCELDTLAMVMVWQALRGLAE